MNFKNKTMNYRQRIHELVSAHIVGIVGAHLVENLLSLCTDIAEDLKHKSEDRELINKKGWILDEEKSPLALADKIVNQRSEERDREYGGFSQSMIKTAKIASELCNKEITTEDAFKVLFALKMSRLSHSLKLDSFVDAIGYLEGLWNFKQENK